MTDHLLSESTTKLSGKRRKTGQIKTTRPKDMKKATQGSTLIKTLLAMTLTISALPMSSQDNSDFGLWTEIGAEKKLNQRWSAGLEAELRTSDKASQTSRWAAGLYGQYRIATWLKARAGYQFLYDRREYENTCEDGSSSPNISFWLPRHRIHFDLTGQYTTKNWTFSLRERWQYTYQPEKTITTNCENTADDIVGSVTYNGKGKNVLRSRIEIDYAFSTVPLTPYISVELYNNWDIEKTRYTAGLEWNTTSHHSLGVFYRFEDMSDNDDTDMHIVCASYKYNF